MDINNLMKIAQQVKEQLSQSQVEAEKIKAVGEAGGGLVRVVMNGRYQVLEISLDPKTLVASERSLLEDLIRAAFNQASIKVGEDLQKKVGNFAQNMGVDLSAFGFPSPK